MRRRLAIVGLLVLAGCCWKRVDLWLPRRLDDAAAARAQQLFLKSLVHNCVDKPAVKRALDVALAESSPPPEMQLYDGMLAIWRAGEEPLSVDDERAQLRHAREALERYARERPDDGRVASWLEGTSFRLARLDGDEAAKTQALERLEDAHDRDARHRLFHNLTLALMLFHEPLPDAPCPDFDARALPACRTVEPRFCRGLCYLAENERGCGPKQGCRMSTRWPHMMSGFLLVMGDYHLKAGDRRGAHAIYEAIRFLSEAAPFHYLVKDRLARLDEYAASFRDPQYPAPGRPRMIMDTPEVACRVCHLSSEAERLSFTPGLPGITP